MREAEQIIQAFKSGKKYQLPAMSGSQFKSVWFELNKCRTTKK